MPLTGDSSETWILLGASRGLGRAFALKVGQQNPNVNLYCFSRKDPQIPGQAGFESFDFSKAENWEPLAEKILSLKARRIFYFAAGGPFGKYQDKEWKDHQWAWKVSFEFPAYLCHRILREPQGILQMVLVGSSVAESHPDPMAGSYSAAKHALLGLISSVQAEKPAVDLRLFSPGYMDTALLPANAWPRQREAVVKSPEAVAETLWTWIHNADDEPKHFVLKSSL